MYHADFGWIYVVSDDHGGLWLWKGLRLALTSCSSAPFFWMNSAADWLYPLHLEQDQQIFWDYGREEVLRLP